MKWSWPIQHVIPAFLSDCKKYVKTKDTQWSLRVSIKLVLNVSVDLDF